MKLSLPKLNAAANLVKKAASAVVSALRAKYGKERVTSCGVHDGTRLYRLLHLEGVAGGEDIDNLFLINVYHSTRDELLEEAEALIGAINAKNLGFELCLVPSGYELNGVDVGSMAYVVSIAVLAPDADDEPEGLLLVQAYHTSREGASALKSSGDNDDKYEYEGSSAS